jgi:hypothetical protein
LRRAGRKALPAADVKQQLEWEGAMLSSTHAAVHVQTMDAGSARRRFGFTEAKEIGDALGIRWDKFCVEQFRMGMNVELEHGRRDPATDVTNDEPMMTGKIALAHLKEIPDYYSRLAVMENGAERVGVRKE